MPNYNDSSAIGITEEQKIALRRAARSGEYHLLLGAGASRDSLSPKGTPLPGSKDLIAMLCKAFNVPFEKDDQLWRIYDRCVAKTSQEQVYLWFRKHFWNVIHPHWMELFARSPWNTVWTLNVDDTFQSAHRAVATETSRKLQSKNWDDPFSDGEALNIVHLHGIVNSEKFRNLVFSLPEYAWSSTTPAAWPRVFHDVYGTSPFVIIGARLRDEPDIESIIAKRNPTHSAPSFYVSRTITEATRGDLENWGLIPVEMSAENFAVEWKNLTGLDLQKDLGTQTELALRVGQQFTDLNNPLAQSPKGPHDFLGGDAPLWSDLNNGYAAELQWISEAQLICKQVGRTLPQSIAIIYTGRRLTGRSTGLLAVGKFLNTESWRIFLFEKKGRIDTEAILSYAADGKFLALLFDGVSQIAEDIDLLISEARKSDLNIVCIGVDQSYYAPSILGRIELTHLARRKLHPINERLKQIDSARIVDTLDRVGRLGILESKNDYMRQRHFKGQRLFQSMSELEQAPGFGLRIKSMINGIQDETMLKIIFIASFASKVDRKLLATDAARMVGIRSEELIRLVQMDRHLESMISTDGFSIEARQRWMALSEIVLLFGEEKSSAILREGIKNVSFRLNKESARERNPTMQLVSAFMTHKNLRKTFDTIDLDAWYNSMFDIFGSWSGRYWEQRAIALRRDFADDPTLLAKAESFALRATQLVPDTYSYTTLGTVLMTKAANPSFTTETFFQRGQRAFEQAEKYDRGRTNLILWTASLTSSIEVLERIQLDLSENEETLPEMSALWDTVYEYCNFAYQRLSFQKDTSEQIEKKLKIFNRSLTTLLQKRKECFRST